MGIRLGIPPRKRQRKDRMIMGGQVGMRKSSYKKAITNLPEPERME